MFGKIVQNKSLISALLFGFLALLVIYVMTSGGMGVTVDSERYLTTAKHLEQGETRRAFRPILSQHPIFYPLTLATIQFFGLGEGASAGRLVSILFFLVSTMVVFFLGLVIQGETTAHLSAFSFLFFAPLVYTFSYCWSETLYVTLSLLFLLMLTLFLEAPKEKQNSYLMVSAIFAGLGFATRYIGLSLVGTGFLGILFLSKHHRILNKLKQVVLFLLVASIPIILNLLVHFLSVGSITRETAPSGFSFFQQLFGIFVSIYHDFLSFDLTFPNYAFLFPEIVPENMLHSPWFWISIIVLLCLSVFLVFFIRSFFSSRPFRRLSRPQRGLVTYIIFYSLLLTVITSSIGVDPMGSRFTTPLYPFILLLVFSSIMHVYKTFTHKRSRRLLFCVVILGIFLFWVIQGISTASIYTGISSGSFPAMENPGNRNRASLKFLKRNLSSTDPLIVNIPEKLLYIWPRKIPHWSFPKLDLISHGIPDWFSQSSAYLLLCTKDRDLYPLWFKFEDGDSLHGSNLHDLAPEEQKRIIEEDFEKRGLFFRRMVFGYDCIYELSFPQENQKP